MKKKILIISRSMPRASKLKKLLNRAGFNCMIINDMPSLEKVDRGHACTAIFMDFSFYVMGGLPFVKGLKILFPGARIIFTGERALNEKMLLKNAVNNGVYGCVKEPFNEDEITAITEGLTAKKAKIEVSAEKETLFALVALGSIILSTLCFLR